MSAPGNLHERIAAALGWPVADTRSLSLRALRDLVRPVDAALAAEITSAVESVRESAGLGRRRLTGRR